MSDDTIKIYARVRPLNKNKKLANKEFSAHYEISPALGEESVSKLSLRVPKDLSVIVNNQKENYNFQFQKVFDVDVQQQEVFDVVAKDVVDNVLDGYNGTIFAYGQTVHLLLIC